MLPAIDWTEFIHMILDGAYAVDIRKTGGVAMFVKNQLGACANPHTETEKFKRSLKEKIESAPFTPEDALAYPGVYTILFDLAGLFLPDWDVFTMKCCSLYLQFSGFKRALSPTTQVEKDELIAGLNGSIVRFIERWKTQFGVMGMQDIYERYGWLESVVKKWRLLVIENAAATGADVVMGLVYLGEWSRFSKQERKAFFQANLANNALFASILSDMERLEENKEYNYQAFADDCRRYHPELFKAIVLRCKNWIDPAVRGDVERAHGDAELIRKFNEWTGTQQDQLGDSAFRDLLGP